MRRWLAVLLLVLLPVQFSWAAVAGFCAHSASAPAHGGHHDHAVHGHADSAASQSAVGDETASTAGAPSTPGTDCGHCHGHVTALAGVAAPHVTLPLRHAPPTLGAAHVAEPTPTQPERPQWARLA
jgi:hypothetical protein